MKYLVLAPLALCTIALTAWGQKAPVISLNGIVNAASYTHPLMPGGGIAQGSLFTIFGANLGPAAPVQANVYPLKTTLSGVSIKVTQGATAVDVVPFYVSPTQVSAIMPSNAPLGAGTISVTFNGSASAASPVTVVASSVGIFAINSGGTGPSVLQNFVSETQLPVNSRTVSAKPGQTLILYGTGLGAALNADNVPPQAGNLAAKTEIFVGGKAAAVAYSGRSPCCSGLDQFVFVVPPDAPLGCNVPIILRTASVTSSNVVTAAISADGGACTNAVAPLGNITDSGKFGTVLLVHSTMGVSAALSISTDLLLATFRKEVGGAFAFNPLFSLPPQGSCTSYTAAGNLFGNGTLPGFAPTGATLNAGALTVSNGTGILVTKPATVYALPIASSTNGTSALTGGPYSIKGGGGSADVGAFNSTVNQLPFLTWSNFAQASTAVRSAGYTVTWSFSPGSAAAEVVVIFGGYYDPASANTAMFYCTAAPADGTFTVPAYILARIPASSMVSGASSLGIAAVGALPAKPQATFSAAGLDAGTANVGSITMRPLTFQ